MTGPKQPRSFDDDMTSKQIAASVRFGRRVTFYVLDYDPVTGYVAGMDKFNYFVLVPSNPIEKKLIHKGNSPLIDLHDESTLDDEPEPVRTELRKIISKFRNKIMTEFYPDVPRGAPSSPED